MDFIRYSANWRVRTGEFDVQKKVELHSTREHPDATVTVATREVVVGASISKVLVVDPDIK